MVAFARLILLASAVAAATTQLLPRDYNTVMNDLVTKIGPQITILDIHVNDFPASGLTGAEEILTDAKTLIQTVTTAIDHVRETGNLGVVASIQILAQIQLRVPLLLATLANIRVRASFWDAIEGPKLALGDLRAGKAAFSNYLDAIIASEPLIQKAGGVAVKEQLMSAFDETIQVYS